jgi:hypothetical protein
VLYIYAEGQHGFKARAEAWIEYTGLKPDRGAFILVPHSFDLTAHSEDEINELLVIAREDLGSMPSLTVIDTLNRNFGGGDENATKDMSTFISACDRIREETRGAVLVVHHTGKDRSRGERGSNVLRGAVDTLIGIRREELDPYAMVECVKQKDAEPFKKFTIDAIPIPLPRSRTSLVLAPMSSQQAREQEERRKHEADVRMLMHFPTLVGDAIDHDQVPAKMRVHRTTSAPRVRDLVRRGLLESTGSGKNGDPYRFYLTHTGGEAVRRYIGT